MKNVQTRILLEGRLHGMNFRYQTQKEAQRLGLVGFVRMLSDGRIEIEVQGSEAAIEKLLEWCQQEPHSSKIRSIFYRHDQVDKSYSDFSVR